MKRPTMLVLEAMLKDFALLLDLSVERDVQCIGRRFEHEGDWFLQVTLPLLSAALESGIEAGSLTCPSNFARHGRLPRFLGGFFKLVFDKDGRLRQDACPYAILAIRQICRFFKKQQIECKPEVNDQAITHFLDVEGELRRATPQMEDEDEYLDKISGIIWAQVFPEPDYLDLVCHHGPGVTADRYLSNERYRIRKWNHRSELTFPSDLHCYPNYGVAAEVGLSKGEGTASAQGVEYLRLRDELPVRVVFVPKTQTAPRVIAIEPSHMQYMQQSVKDLMYAAIESHGLTKHSIRFTDQSVNQRLAYSSSIDKRLATLDLKDASDRVHFALVQRIFKTSGLLHYLEDARSLHATLPNDQNIVLSKYASMGSALCFPVEACVFYTLIQCAMHQVDGLRPCSRSVAKFSKQIAVYGDDIIVPVRYTDAVVGYLEKYCLKVNISKSFRHSNFRESCGADYYNGTPVNPVYAKKSLPDDLRRWGADEIVSWNEAANLFYQRGMWQTCQALRDLLHRVVRRTIPRARKLTSGLAHFSYLFDTGLHWNAELCGWKQKRLHYVPSKKKDCIDGYELACLNKWGISTHFRSLKSHLGRENSSTHRRSQPYGLERDVFGRSTLRLGALEVWRDEGGHRDGVLRSHLEDTDTRLADISVPDISYTSGDAKAPCAFVRPLVRRCDPVRVGESDVSARPEFDFSADYCLTESQIDPLGHLFGSNVGLDFLASTKRGSFKSKYRWTSLAS